MAEKGSLSGESPTHSSLALKINRTTKQEECKISIKKEEKTEKRCLI